MAFKFSQIQELAIKATGQNVLVSAGAGSGKTAVLTERVFRLLTVEKVPLSQLLVLTFTNAAAHEMKARIKGRLKKAQMMTLADEVDNALITTFDAFAYYLVRKYHYRLGLEPHIENVEGVFINILREQMLSEICDEYYENKDPRFASLITTYTVKNADAIWNLIYKFDEEIDRKIDSETYLNTYLDTHFTAIFFDEIYQRFLDIAAELIDEIYCYLDLIGNPDHQQALDTYFSEIIAKDQIEDTLKNVRRGVKNFPINKRNYDEDDKVIHEEIKTIFNQLKELANLGTKEENYLRYQQTKDHVTMIVELTAKLRKRVTDYKWKHQIFTFGDIAKMAMQLLDDEEVITELRDQIKYIIVDEYQDTSDLQEALLNKLEDHNLYMVGDIKQSIYRFRNANSDIFQAKYASFQDPNQGLAIDMNENFRSRAEVLDDINSIFSDIMTLKYGGADYRHQHQIIFGNAIYESKGKLRETRASNILLYDGKSEDPIEKTLSTAEKEAVIIARQIKSLIDNQFLVYDRDIEGNRPITYRDIVILVDRRTNFLTYQKILESFYIPLKVHQDREIKTAEGTQVLHSLVRLIVQLEESEADHPILRHGFLSVARSYLYQLDDDLTYRLLTEEDGQKYLNHPLMIKVKEFAKNTRDLPLKQRINQVIYDFGLIDKLPLIGDIQVNLYLFEALVSTAGTLEKLHFNLKDFSDYFTAIAESDRKLEISDYLAPENAVQLMTIHKSKGLEFPVVFYCGLSSRFNFDDFKGNLLVDKDYGLILPYPENPLAPILLKQLTVYKEKVAAISEEIRLLYVALTRAREKIFLVLPKNPKGIIKPISKCQSFAQLLYRWKEFDQRTIFMDSLSLPEVVSTTEDTKLETPSIEVSQYDFVFEKVKPKTYSKSLDLDADQAFLIAGENLHYLLSIVNWECKDTSFIADPKARMLVDQVVNLDIFRQLTNSQIYTEYEFYDPTIQKMGIIDFFALQEDGILLVDFKLSGIDDDAYDEQVRNYAHFLAKTFHLPIRAYLVSINKGSYRRVELPG